MSALAAAVPPPGTWNDRFRGPEALLGEFPDRASLLGSGCCGTGGFVIGSMRLEEGQLVWGALPLLQRGALGAWDRQQVFGPHTFVRDGLMVMLYSGAPGEVSSEVLQHTIGFAVSGDGLTWRRPTSDNRLLAPQPGNLIEFPFLLEEEINDRLFVTIKPHPDGLHAIHTAIGRLVVPVE